MERIVLAYSGGLDTSVAIPWMAERYDAEIIAVTMDLGQGRELEEVRDRALATGAVRAHVLDLREEFARDYALRALKAGATLRRPVPMAAALGRPLIAQKLVEIAALEQATAVAHGCTATGHDQVRLDAATRALNPSLKIIAPARVWSMTRAEEIEYARARSIPAPPRSGDPAHRRESVGAIDRMRRARGPLAGAARGHLLADPSHPPNVRTIRPRSSSRSSAACRPRINGVADAPGRADRQPGDDCRRARRGADRPGRGPAARRQVARGPRGPGRRGVARGAPGAPEARDRAGSRSSRPLRRACSMPTSCTTACGSRRCGRRSMRSSRRCRSVSPARCVSSCSRAAAGSSAAGRRSHRPARRWRPAPPARGSISRQPRRSLKL